jgi:hypothetical protein
VAETTKPTTKSDGDTDAQPPAKSTTPRSAADPSRHAASSDPAVHKLLADRQSYETILADLEKPADPDAVKAAKAEIAAIDKKLDEL